MTTIFKNGDKILVSCEGRTLQGEMVMISDNQVSVMIAFDGALGGHVGMMPAMRHNKDAGIYRSIIDGTEITFEKRIQK